MLKTIRIAKEFAAELLSPSRSIPRSLNGQSHGAWSHYLTPRRRAPVPRGCATSLWCHSRKLSQSMTSRRPCSVSFSLRRQACHVGGLADRSRRADSRRGEQDCSLHGFGLGLTTWWGFERRDAEARPSPPERTGTLGRGREFSYVQTSSTLISRTRPSSAPGPLARFLNPLPTIYDPPSAVLLRHPQCYVESRPHSSMLKTKTPTGEDLNPQETSEWLQAPHNLAPDTPRS